MCLLHAECSFQQTHCGKEIAPKNVFSKRAAVVHIIETKHNKTNDWEFRSLDFVMSVYFGNDKWEVL